MNLRPLQDRILVQRVEEESTTKGGIIIPDSAKEKPAEGKVVAVGNGKVSDDGKRIELRPLRQPDVAELLDRALGQSNRERLMDLVSSALGNPFHIEEVLRTLGYRVVSKLADGSLGWEAFAPFDGILATAGAAKVPDALIGQLRLPEGEQRGGRLMIPVGESTDQTMLRLTRTGADTVDEERLGQFRFVPFVGADLGPTTHRLVGDNDPNSVSR